ncbi:MULTISPECIES: tetraacyldisaccharide 4'-kinase [unclassified Nitrobacter]|uniref:tetraacyldisaccharide 4'-kinase n=1 Tax=unclassified Nitrobacter TaxID=2620411 RepID=UPI00092BEFBD|nr:MULTISPECIES: tetraacyldisaccharide 4'-kinase [unclassified Nitrobacter]MBN9149350.1 tetraacyldisaccharide 4'-kinase [Nitrobacter sp.]OJU99204.1 MAG: tetraacyldisaccharide 4'-kinase [Nitrobacter sp. 62-23]
MREPAFWHRPSSLRSQLLAPLGALYGAVAARRLMRTGLRAGVPVICVGNYGLGGAGKTPTVMALAGILRSLGETPVVLSRGYGGRLHGPLQVDADRHTATEVGDEPLMMARTIPVIVSRQRTAGTAPARALGASVILLDDGFQNPAIAKDTSLIVIDAARGLGNKRVFPAGPLRAPLPAQLSRTDVLVIIGLGAAADGVAANINARGGLVLRAKLVPDDGSVAALRGRRVCAFAGIGDPARFFRSLRACGVDVAAERAFADHHPFSQSDVAELREVAARDGLALVTTEKDLARLRNSESLKAFAQDVVPFAVTLAFDDEPALRSFLAGRIAQARR